MILDFVWSIFDQSHVRPRAPTGRFDEGKRCLHPACMLLLAC